MQVLGRDKVEAVLVYGYFDEYVHWSMFENGQSSQSQNVQFILLETVHLVSIAKVCIGFPPLGKTKLINGQYYNQHEQDQTNPKAL